MLAPSVSFSSLLRTDPEILQFAWLSQLKSLRGNAFVFRLFLQTSLRFLNIYLYTPYTPFVCSHLCPLNLIFLSLGQYIRSKNSKGITVFFGRFCTDGFYPFRSNNCLRALGGDGVRFSPHFDFY